MTTARLSYIAALTCLAACGGYSTQEAYERCEEERTVKPTVNDEAFAECVACYEDCGNDCQPQATSPESYLCPP